MIDKIKTYNELFEKNDKMIDCYIDEMVLRILHETESKYAVNYINNECVDSRKEQLKNIIKNNIYSYLVTNKFIEKSVKM